MKKTLLAVLATVLIAGGGVGAPAAVAAEEYPGTVETATDVGGPRKMAAKKKPKSSAYIRTAGNGKPIGSIRVQYLHKGSQKSRYKTVGYNGQRITFFGPTLRRVGVWQVRAVFRAKSGSVWKSSKDSYSFKVVRKR